MIAVSSHHDDKADQEQIDSTAANRLQAMEHGQQRLQSMSEASGACGSGDNPYIVTAHCNQLLANSCIPLSVVLMSHLRFILVVFESDIEL